MLCFSNSDHVIFSRECAFCLFVNKHMHMPKTKLKRKKNSSLGYHHVVWNRKTKPTGWKPLLRSSIIFLVDSQLPLHYKQKYITQASDELLDVHFVRLFTYTLYGLQYIFPNFVHSCTYFKLFLGVALQLRRNWWFKILCSCEIIALVLRATFCKYHG